MAGRVLMPWLISHEAGCSAPCSCGALDRTIIEEDEDDVAAMEAGLEWYLAMVLACPHDDMRPIGQTEADMVCLDCGFVVIPDD